MGPEDIRKVYAEIREILGKIEDNKSKSLKKKCTPELLEQCRRLQGLLIFFQDFNDMVFKKMGISEDMLKKTMSPKGKAGWDALDPLVKEADKLRCEVVISQASFLREQYKDVLDANRPFAAVTKTSREGLAPDQKKKVKKKFKTMEERMKWKKL